MPVTEPNRDGTDALGALCEAAVAALNAVASAERLSFNVRAVRQRAESLLAAAGLASLPEVATSASGQDSRLALVGAHAAELEAAVELKASLNDLNKSLAAAYSAVKWTSSLAPPGDPARMPQLRGAAELLGEVFKAAHQLDFTEASRRLREFGSAFPWTLTFVRASSKYVVRESIGALEEAAREPRSSMWELYLGWLSETIQELVAKEQAS